MDRDSGHHGQNSILSGRAKVEFMHGIDFRTMWVHILNLYSLYIVQIYTIPLTLIGALQNIVASRCHGSKHVLLQECLEAVRVYSDIGV